MVLKWQRTGPCKGCGQREGSLSCSCPILQVTACPFWALTRGIPWKLGVLSSHGWGQEATASEPSGSQLTA